VGEVRRSSIPLLWLTVFVVVALMGAPARAMKYRPKDEETLSHIALIHYGNPKKFIYLAAANGLADPDHVPKGKVLWVPTVWKYRLKRGESLSVVATRYLKDAKRSDFLAWLNRIRNPKDLEAGTLITVPFVLRHRVQQGQSMVDVAKRYYFRSKQTSLLRKFNGKRTNALKPGEIILVPIYDREAYVDKVKERLKGYQDKPAKATKESGDKAKPSPAATGGSRDDTKPDPKNPGDTTDPKVASATEAAAEILDAEDAEEGSIVSPPEDVKFIQKGFELYRDGEYDLAQANLMRVLEKGRLAQADEAEAREILAFCLVALDRKKEAEHEFVRLLMVAPERSLDPVTTSPKILEVFKRAKGAR
jgi:LysM repeat protein